MKRNVYVVTGASRGLGLAIAQLLLEPDSAMLCVARKSNPLLQDLAQSRGAILSQWTEDLENGRAVAAKLEAWLESLNPQEIASATLINNAGLIPPLVALRDSNAANTALALRVGLEAPMLLSAAFLGATRSWQLPRKVLNISSGLGRRPMASQAAYCAAKAGMDHFTRCLALEEALSPNGAKVCSLAPGVIATDMQLQLREADPTAFPDQKNFANLHATGKLVSPEEAAHRVIAYLNRADFGIEAIGDVR